MKTQDRLPDFLIIGAGKSGTTALLHFLNQHPDVFLPHRKEPNFFALEGIKVEDHELEESRVYHQRSINNLKDYLDLFKDADNNQIVGENSNLYLYSDSAISNIQKYVPKAKLIALLRNPTERLMSRYNHLVRENAVPDGGDVAIFDKSSVWWKRPDLLIEGFYGAYLEKYFEVFPQGQIKIILYDDFKSDNKAVMKGLFQFIGVDENFEPDTEIILNKSGKLIDNSFNKWLGQNGILIRKTKKIFPGIHKSLKENQGIQKVLTAWRNKNMEVIEFPDSLKKRITNEIYKEDILRLEKVIGRSLKHWY